jgi:hypothetical protein
MTFGTAMLYAVVTAVVVAIVKVGPAGVPMEWLNGVVRGFEGEYFAGTSVNSFQSVEGMISGAWWLFFVAVDALLFCFLYLVFLGVGLSSEAGGRLESVRADLPIDVGSRPLGTVAFGVFLGAAVAAILFAVAWPSLTFSGGDGAPARLSVAEIQGEWIFGEEAGFLGEGDEALRFTLSTGLGEELAAFSAVPSLYMIVLEPRRDGAYEGRLMMRGRGELPVLMRAAPGAEQLVLTVRGIDRSGALVERELMARRTSNGG